MKLIIREYLSSLRERDELDAILPDILSELGYTVFSRPGRGTAQSGVDVAAVRKETDGERKVFLLAIKRGDLTRQSWDGTPQGLRATLNEIQDVYIPTKLPTRYRGLKVVIAICLGGEIKEQVRSHLTGYESQHENDYISFEEWTGDEISDMLLRGVLREQILPIELRSSFRKAVAMVDEPDVAFRHFAALVHQLTSDGQASQIARVRAARLLYVCLWILFVWARDIDNVEAPYQASELTLLATWDMLRPLVGKKSKNARMARAVLDRLLMLHFVVAGELLDRKVLPHVSKPFVVSTAVQGGAVDVNLKLFDLLGRISMAGLWRHWMGSADDEKAAANLFRFGTELIKNNSCLALPLCDHQAIDVALFLLLGAAVGSGYGFVADWLGEMARRFHLTVRAHGRYPSTLSGYRELVAHPREQSDEYRQSATAGSILIPLLAAWLTGLGRSDEYQDLTDLKRNELRHCTLQLWLPDYDSEEAIYRGCKDHGSAVELDLPMVTGGDELLDIIEEACHTKDGLSRLSAIKAGCWPIILLSCRHHRYPVPPQFWIKLFRSKDRASAAPSSSHGSVSAEVGGSEENTTEVTA